MRVRHGTKRQRGAERRDPP